METESKLGLLVGVLFCCLMFDGSSSLILILPYLGQKVVLQKVIGIKFLIVSCVIVLLFHISFSDKSVHLSYIRELWYWWHRYVNLIPVCVLFFHFYCFNRLVLSVNYFKRNL